MTARSLRLIPFLAAVIYTFAAAATSAAVADEQLTAGVRTIAAPGTPGTLAVWSDKAIVLAIGQDDGAPVPVAAAGIAGAGRIAAFSHTGHLDTSSLSVGEHGKLLENVARWASRQQADKPARVGLINCKLKDFFKQLKFEVVELGADFGSAAIKDRVDLVCMVGNALSDEQIAAIADFVAAGGGLMAAQTAWAWKVPPGQTLLDNPLNRIAAPAGIAWTGAYAGKNSTETFDVATAAMPLVNAAAAVEALAVEAMPRTDASMMDKATIRAATVNATAAARLLPVADTILRPRLTALLEKHAGELNPAPASPIDLSKPLQRFLLAFQLAQLEMAEPHDIKTHISARTFPSFGVESRIRRRRSLDVRTAVPGWHSTGFYAQPGKLMRVEIPEHAVGLGLRVRVGCHKDELWHLDSWKRAPEITFEEPLSKSATPLMSAFGGLVYIVVPPGCEPLTIGVLIHGGMDAPLFVHGATDLENWRNVIRNQPGPWAELATDNVVLSVPSSAIRTLDDPAALMTLWDRALDAAADLAAMPRQRERPERFVADVQISAGYMHSGYPIMTHLDAVEDMTDASRLAKGSWGLFHELGHNHQSSDWTFDGTVEVTCNLFSLYICESVCGLPMSTGHPALEKREETIGRYLAKGAKFAEWKSEPFTALIMYMQLREAFGWEAYKKVFAEYRGLPEADRPKTDDDKRDQWMVRFSRTVGKNLGPFFEAWGVPTSAAARQSISELPAWMPEGFPPKP